MVKDLSSPAWILTLRAISYSAGPQPDHRSAVTKDDLLKLVAVCDTDPSLVPLRVALDFGFLDLDLKWTKTLQTQRSVTTIPLAALQDRRICPASTWELYWHKLHWITPDSSTPLLLTTAPPVGKVISASTLRAMFHRAADSAGLSNKHYTPHSLWRGGASFCFQVSDPLEHIKKHGTWTSHTWQGSTLPALTRCHSLPQSQ